MEALQYIYTSWKNGDSTEKGYMIYSRSEGISDVECSAIKDAMQYLAPKELTLTPTPQEIADIFPYAFSYFILPTGRGCVAQSTYLGKDYSGRYGNYIIYALVFDIDDLPCRPAELFAEQYMKTAMTEEELNAPSPVPPLPPLDISEYSSIINDEQLNEFLFDKEEEFAQLISMILASRDAGIPFYLNDSRENLVLWSAAFQRILPSRLSKKFTFNTYIGDHESMRSQRAREEGLDFYLIGVRPDANYFNYATESRSNRHIVMDFIGGHMTEGVTPNSYAYAMASSIAFDCEEVDSFGEFIDSTSFSEINGHLQDAYLYYHLLKDDEFDFTEDNLRAVLSFGETYCSEADNSDIGGKLLVKYQENAWTISSENLLMFWNFICKHTGFMIFTLFDLFTETVYQHAGEAAGPLEGLDKLIQAIKNETPIQYKEYLNYTNSQNCVDHLQMYLAGHKNPFTNNFYVTWILNSYTFVCGLEDAQPISKLLKTLFENIAHTNGCEKKIIEILFATSDNRSLFEDTLSVFMSAFKDPSKLDLLCSKYVEVSGSITDRELNRFEQLLLETPGASPIATRLCAKKIAASKNPDEDFWRIYNNQRTRIIENSGFSIEPMILACVNNVDFKKRDDVAIDILRKIDSSLINDRETVLTLTSIVNDCSVKTLSKMDPAFLEKVCRVREKIENRGLDKIKAVSVGEMLASNNSQRMRPINLATEINTMGISLSATEKSDYEAYIKNYFAEYLASIQSIEDIPAVMKIFRHSRFFSNFADDYISALKKMEKKDPERWKRITGWTCVYLVSAERSDPSAEDLYKPIVRYLRSLDEGELLVIRQAVNQDVPSSRSDYLFDEVRRKEGFSEKLSNLFHKK